MELQSICPPTWTGELLARMHNAKVKRVELAAELNVTKAYITMVLNGRREPKGAEQKLTDAFEKILARRTTPAPLKVKPRRRLIVKPRRRP